MYVCDMPIHGRTIPPKAIIKLHIFELDEEQMYDPNTPTAERDVCAECYTRLTEGPKPEPKRRTVKPVLT